MKLVLLLIFILVVLVLVPSSFFIRSFANLTNFSPIKGGRGLLQLELQNKLRNIPNTNYTYAFIDAAGKNISLILNTQNKLTSGEIIKNNKCEFALSGGFYSSEYGPIGQVVINGVQVSTPSDSNLFIGYTVSAAGTHAQILREPAQKNVTWALQSGPIVYDEGQTTINIKNDVSARRNVLLTDIKNNIYFATIATKDNEFNGPTLKELGELVVKIADAQNIKISQAINLDGGHHSFFKNTDTYLQETSHAGTAFCIR